MNTYSFPRIRNDGPADIRVLAGRCVADLVSGRDPGQAARIAASIDPTRFAAIAA
jgi:hypothetical protein